MQDDIIGQPQVCKFSEYRPQIQVFCWAEESNDGVYQYHTSVIVCQEDEGENIYSHIVR